MKPAIRNPLPALVALFCGAVLLAGCGGGQKHAAVRPQPQPRSPVSFGISQDYLDVAGDSAAQTFASRVLGATGHVRLFVPYDARGYWDGGQCASSPDYEQGAPAWNTLTQQLLQANTQHLRVEIVFAAGSGSGAVPHYPNPAITAQSDDYRCGIQMALSSIADFAAENQLPMPTEFEAWNEPNLDVYGKYASDPCPSPATDTASSCSGPWQAAMLWYLAQTAANQLRATGTVPPLTFAALTVSAPQLLPFIDDGDASLREPDGVVLDGYYQQLYAIVHCLQGYGGCTDPADDPRTLPTVWAVHDYADVTGAGTGDLTLFEQTLADLNDQYDSGHGARIWITEAAVDLGAPMDTDINHPDGVTCDPGDSDTSANSFGCLVDGRPQAQAAGAAVWKVLPSLRTSTQSGSVSVTQLYWYQFQLGSLQCSTTSPCALSEYASAQADVPALHAWDSALVAADGQPRVSFCVITGLPLTQCHGRSTDYVNAHWIPWWTPDKLPSPCPDEHDGAWVANRSGSGVPGGEECYYDVDPPPPTVVAAAASGG